MSDLGVLSHAYAEWNAHLGEMNRWLFSLRKMKDGLVPAPERVDIPEDVRSVLANIAETFNPSSERPVSAVPLTIKRKLGDRLKDETEAASHRLSELLNAAPFSLDDLSSEDIVLLTTIVASLDGEVTSLYNRMRRTR
ncbi:MAG TPA: hypothetical protein EYP19_14730 [Desulfobacterales bacterium]|nr:hypothetical protein [Desulfobacterales bacterium]